MESINMIFDNYGNERLGRIFGNYWVLLLLLKEVMFSLFLAEPPIANPLPVEVMQETRQVIATPRESAQDYLYFPRLLRMPAQLDSNSTTDTSACATKMNPPIHHHGAL